jgi:raffinose/stachyose/melibiose transport system permease protein
MTIDTLSADDVVTRPLTRAHMSSPARRRVWLSRGGGVVVILACIVFITPVLIMIITALQPFTDILANGPAAFPHSLTLSNFSSAWTSAGLGTFYLNSMLILIVKVPLGILVASLAAYPLAKARFRGRKLTLVLILVGLGVPQVITLYPLLRLTNDMGLSGSLWVLLLPYLAFGLPFEILVMRGAFRQIPHEVLEAARVDGASELRIWGRICMPSVLAPIAALALLDGVATWNEFIIALTLLTSRATYTLPLGINGLVGEFSINYSQLEAGVFICVLPMILLFIIARRYLIHGVASGGVKG